MLAVHPEHPLAQRESVRVGALRDEPFVTLTHASRLRHVLEAICAQAGFTPRIAAETTDLAVMVMLAAEGVGVALLPRSGLDGAEGVVPLDVTHPSVDRRIVLVWRADYVPPAARAFLALGPAKLFGVSSAPEPTTEHGLDFGGAVKRAAFFVVVLAIAIALILTLPGVGEIRDRLSSATHGWIALAALCSMLSMLGFVRALWSAFDRVMRGGAHSCSGSPSRARTCSCPPAARADRRWARWC